jgi:uncharacterized protein YodC (DUF2158 family)
MKFRSGDSVIKQTGGNVMKVIQYSSEGVCCGWISENYHEKTFRENELLTLNEYNLLSTKTLRREELIEEILK